MAVADAPQDPPGRRREGLSRAFFTRVSTPWAPWHAGCVFVRPSGTSARGDKTMKALDKKVIAGFGVAILALATVTPFAEAHAYGRRTSNSDYYRGPATIHRSYPSSGYYRRSSNAGPILAGFFGGLLLGAVLTNHANGQ